MDSKRIDPELLIGLLKKQLSDLFPKLYARLTGPRITEQKANDGQSFTIIEFHIECPEAEFHKFVKITLSSDEITVGTALDHAHFGTWDFDDENCTPAELAEKMVTGVVDWLKVLIENRMLAILYFDKESPSQNERLAQVSTRILANEKELKKLIDSITKNGPKRKTRAEAHLWTQKVYG